MKIGDRIYVRGYIDEIRKDTVIVRNDGGYFGTILSEIITGELPSAQTERKKGKWIPVTNGRGGFECDECHNYAPSFQDGVEWLSDYCPNCGADMRGEKDG